eukprot:Clim_evm19s218 gene=Clim_evmTU19s218
MGCNGSKNLPVEQPPKDPNSEDENNDPRNGSDPAGQSKQNLADDHFEKDNMGGGQSKDQTVAKAKSMLSTAEYRCVCEAFENLTGNSKDPDAAITKRQWVNYITTLSVPVGAGFFDAFLSTGPPLDEDPGTVIKGMPFSAYLMGCAIFLSRNVEKISLLVARMLIGENVQFTMERLAELLQALIASAMNMDETAESAGRLAQYFLERIKKYEQEAETHTVVPTHGITTLARLEPIFCDILYVIVSQSIIAPFSTSAQDVLSAPALSPNMKGGSGMGLLDTPMASLLSYQMSAECRKRWSVVYSRRKDGASFAKFQQTLLKSGQCVVVIRDRGGFVFGCYNFTRWRQAAQFYGDSRSFVFSAKPKVAIHTPQGHNDNYMYLNFGQQTLANGFGVGGQMGYHAIWIDQNFEDGHCKGNPSTTYGNPQFTENEEFEVADIEVIEVCPPPKDEDEEDGAGTSILDKDQETNLVMELAGRGQKSKHIRQAKD